MKHIRKFNIKEDTKKSPKRNCYEIVVEFMIGDADGYKKKKFLFTEDKMNDIKFKKYVSDFIDSIEECIELDNNGRVGFDDPVECSEWYAGGFDRCHDQYKGVPSWSRFCKVPNDIEEDEDVLPLKDDNEELINMEPFQQTNNPFAYDIPTHDDGYYCSYDSISLYYYDKNGDKSEVSF